MGFRDPITTAAAVDTGPAGAPSVYLTEGNDGLGNSSSTYGIVGFRDGFNDTDATITRRTVVNPRSQVNSGGGSVTYDSGSYAGGKAGPKLVQSMTVDGTGAASSLTQITGDRLSIATTSIDVATTAITLNALFKSAGSGAGGTPAVDQIANRVDMRGAIANASSPYSASAGTVNTLGSIPAALAPGAKRWWAVALLTGSGYTTALVSVDTTGAITFVPQAAMTVGFALNLNGIRWLIGVA